MDIVGYDAKGRAITLRQFIDKVEQEEAEYQSGNYKTIDDLEKELTLSDSGEVLHASENTNAHDKTPAARSL